MQIQQGYTKVNAFTAAHMILRSEGILGFFKGCIPPLWGSMIYRGTDDFVKQLMIHN